MPRMPRNDSSKNASPLDSDLSDALKSSESTKSDGAPVNEDPAPTDAKTVESSVPDPAPEVEVKEAAPVKVVFDPEFAVDDRISEVVVSVAGTPCYTFPVDGTPVEVPADDAALLVENSPAVKEAN